MLASYQPKYPTFMLVVPSRIFDGLPKSFGISLVAIREEVEVLFQVVTLVEISLVIVL